MSRTNCIAPKRNHEVVLLPLPGGLFASKRTFSRTAARIDGPSFSGASASTVVSHPLDFGDCNPGRATKLRHGRPRRRADSSQAYWGGFIPNSSFAQVVLCDCHSHTMVGE